MSYREIPKNRVLRFSGTPGFKGWKDFFTKESITHPAKMNLKLLRHILEAHTSPGDVVLDPMAGTGSTVVLAAMLGRHGIAVEYETHFCNMIRENIKRTEPQSTLMPKGRMTCIQGDARELSKLLNETDAIITSPPYSEGIGYDPGDGASEEYKERLEMQKKYTRQMASKGNIAKLKHGDIEAIITSPPYGSDNANLMERKDKSAQSVLSTTGVRAVPLEEDNIGVLEYGDVDAVITSPPYAHESTASKPTILEKEGEFKMGHSREVLYTDEDYRFKKDRERGNIGKTKLFKRVPCSPEEAEFHDDRPGREGTIWEWTKEIKIEVDAVVTSPPYGNRLSDEAVQDGDPQRMSYRQAVDSIVTSPPYEGSRAPRGRDSTREQIETRLRKAGYSEDYIGRYFTELFSDDKMKGLGTADTYGEDTNNIGNLKSESYLDAMLQCYREFFKVLKEGGAMVLVVKNFIRNKAVVRLDLDTISIAEAVGFTLKDRWYFKLPQRSFWRILYKRRFPDVSEVEYEDILIFKKEAEK